MELDLETLNELAKLTGENARLEADRFESYIVYMNEHNQVIKEHFDRSVEIIEDCAF